MRLIIHNGLHKTASTYVQTLFCTISTSILERGIYYEAGEHHPVAWAVLRGDFEPFRKMISRARASGCHTIIVSAEDLENLLFDLPTAQSLESEAFRSGIKAIDWLICVRPQSDYFWSLYAEMSRHTYLDPFAAFYQVIIDGRLRVPATPRKAGPPHWDFCFDYRKYFPAFASKIQGRVHIYDFADNSPYPLWKVFSALGVADLAMSPSRTAVRNERASDDAVAQQYGSRFCEAIDQSERDAFAGELILRTSVDAKLKARMTMQLANRF